MIRLRFEVEQAVMIAQHLPVVLARALEGAGFVLTETSTLGGYPLAQFLEIPRSVRADGSPRLDLFAFALADSGDLTHFVPGQVVVLEAVAG